MSHTVLILLQQAEHNYAAYAPEVPGCVATGKTRQDALENIHEALRLHFMGMAEDGEALPESADPSDEAQFVDIEWARPTKTLNQAS
jgi:predicted RNase H-like HicB family nuclease